ncbi:unnamed protein product [Closterium sp. Naga37s-1]|nr:unnamed protein product [Closterium sp. Naga37s-1]
MAYCWEITLQAAREAPVPRVLAVLEAMDKHSSNVCCPPHLFLNPFASGAVYATPRLRPLTSIGMHLFCSALQDTSKAVIAAPTAHTLSPSPPSTPPSLPPPPPTPAPAPRPSSPPALPAPPTSLRTPPHHHSPRHRLPFLRPLPPAPKPLTLQLRPLHQPALSCGLLLLQTVGATENVGVG